jgi:spermidine synthase
VYVWGSLIGVFLAALSLGYAIGGRISTRWPIPGPFLALVFASGASIFPIPHVAGALLGQIVAQDFGPRANPLLGGAELFFLPSALLGTISPYAVRLRARSVEAVGNVAGMLYALSTLGSIVGTLLAAFVLISVFGVRAIIQLLGITEMALAVLGFMWFRRAYTGAGAAAVMAAILGIASGVPANGSDVVYTKDTIYHRITVSDGGAVRYLKLDNYWQSARDQSAPSHTVFAYTDYLHLPLLFVPHPSTVLFIGMGGGTAPTRFHHDYPAATIEVVEIDPTVVDVARKYFSLPDDDRLRVHLQDGRLRLRRTNARYDVIVLDAYLIDTIPFHLATQEFYRETAAHLTPGGAVASNVIGALRGRQSRLFRAIYKTFQSVFPVVYVFPVGGGPPDNLKNIILVGTQEPGLGRSEILRRAREAARTGRVQITDFATDAATLYDTEISTYDVPLLTDNYAPTDILIASQR